ncbi:serine/threonine-protein kinase [Leptolyngbya iicbica]|uniref:non-specific serine/threonine protein kinase n=2 Tax=Cyanophyceae TaxID=3028117 RepID=A0A4Q7E5U0_9CYAN|nr:serine/threonine-protein kinase [Leptolyngbya sp. LK]RZM77722.1 serine/threonine protein kinase [Leptolyngbya sp. LK]
MEIVCTRPTCPRPANHFADLENSATLTTVQQKFCTACGMPLILSGRYLPEKLLGQGGFGAAYLARDRYTPNLRPCVVKLFQPSGDLNPDQLALAQSLFQREAAVLEEIGRKHLQIPDLYAFFPLMVPSLKPGKQEEYFYLVQEFIDGEDLEQALARSGPLSASDMIEVLVSMLKVLSFVHDNGTIHRDIKPSNIMRHRDGRLYLLDFGAVKQVTAAQGKPSGRSTGIYSIGFAPPEQMAGGEVYPSTDLYALAVTCITLLTGKEAGELYDSYNNSWAWRAHAQINPAIADVLDRMLLPVPNQRYESAKAVLAALRQAASSGSANAAAPPPPRAATSPAAPSPNTAMQTPASAAAPTAPAPPAAPPGLARPPKGTKPVKAKSASPAASASQSTAMSSVSLVEFLSGAAFTGFEGGLLAIALLSLLGTTLLGSGAWLLLLAVLILLQVRRVIERFDLVIIAVVTLGVVLLFPPLQAILATSATPRITVIVLAVMAGLAAIAIGTLFRLIYRLLSTFM